MILVLDFGPETGVQLVWFSGEPFIYTQDDMMSPILTLCFLLVRKDAAHVLQVQEVYITQLYGQHGQRPF